MKKKRSDESEKLLTDVELELMTILWKLKEGNVAAVLGELPSGRSLAYTSVSTVLRILEQKQILRSRKEGKGHVYVPLLSKDEYEKKTIRHVVDRVFEGTPSLLVKKLLDTSRLSEGEMREIKALIQKMEKDS